MKNNEDEDLTTDPVSALMATAFAGVIGGCIGSLLSTVLVVVGKPVTAAIAKIFGASVTTRESILNIDPFMEQNLPFGYSSS